ncbi:unnamed protein product [Sphagnum balticum]
MKILMPAAAAVAYTMNHPVISIVIPIVLPILLSVLLPLATLVNLNISDCASDCASSCSFVELDSSKLCASTCASSCTFRRLKPFSERFRFPIGSISCVPSLGVAGAPGRVEEVSHVIASPSIVEAALQFPRREQMKLVLDTTEYSVQDAREALNASLAQYEPLMLVVAAMASCFLLSISTSAVNSAVWSSVILVLLSLPFSRLLETHHITGQVCGNAVTDSILMAEKPTRDFMKATGGITAPEM